MPEGVPHKWPGPTEQKGQAPGYPKGSAWNYEVPQTTLYKTRAKPKYIPVTSNPERIKQIATNQRNGHVIVKCQTTIMTI